METHQLDLKLHVILTCEHNPKYFCLELLVRQNMPLEDVTLGYGNFTGITVLTHMTLIIIPVLVPNSCFLKKYFLHIIRRHFRMNPSLEPFVS